MNRIVKVFSPASVSNVGSGYDIMGFAIDGPGDILELEINDSGIIFMENSSESDIPCNKSNVVYPALKKMLISANSNYGVNVNFLKKINPGSGIGSSAASSVGAVFALNHLLGEVFTAMEMIEFAMEGEQLVSGEAHADNIAPCLFGGFTLIRSYKPLDIISIPYPENLICTVVHPDIIIKTSDSRKVIRKEIPIKDAVVQTGNAAALIAGLIQNNLDLIGRSVKDIIAEPYRRDMIPGYEKAKELALAGGAIAFNISGSGPSLFAFSDDIGKAETIGKNIASVFSLLKIESNIYVSKISDRGVRILSEN